MANIESKIKEYYERTLALKPMILADQSIQSNIMSAVNHQYNKETLDEEVMLLGKGSSNKIYNVGSVIDPNTQLEIPIAVRLMQYCPLFLKNERGHAQLENEIREYEAAYVLGEKTPYFTGVVTFMPYGESAPELISAGILTEDISNKCSLILKEIDYSRVERTNKDKSKETFFVDPDEFRELNQLYSANKISIVKNACNGEKYLADNARIDLPSF